MQNIELKNNILKLFYEANKNFLQNNLSSILIDISERNMCSNLSHEISLLKDKFQFSDYYADAEYDRNGPFGKTIIDENEEVLLITCDLIFHSRGTKQKDNLLTLEMKKLPSNKKLLDKDRNRLKALTKQAYDNVFLFNDLVLPQHVCGYEVGIYYLIDTSKKEITLEIYADGKFINRETNSFEYFMNYK